jgi:hypothetical protein
VERENRMVQLLLLDDALYPTLNEHPVSKGHNPINCISIDVTNTTSLVESHEHCAQKDASINVPVFLLSNVMSLVPKIDEVRIVANSVNPDFNSVTETWLQNHVHSNFVELNCYNIVRKDRQAGTHGGICLYRGCPPKNVPYHILWYYIVTSHIIYILFFLSMNILR